VKTAIILSKKALAKYSIAAYLSERG